jgi:hypothetical protein
MDFCEIESAKYTVSHFKEFVFLLQGRQFCCAFIKKNSKIKKKHSSMKKRLSEKGSL